ncbi:MAG: hypothetical protein AAF916_11965 [Planctomycetota bacterium]
MPELSDSLKAYVLELAKLQQTGKYATLMGYSPARGKHVHLKATEGDDHATACDGITREDLRKLQAAGLISVNTPRSTWTFKLRSVAFDLA